MIVTQGVVFAGIMAATTIIGLYAVYRTTHADPSPYLHPIDLQEDMVILYQNIPHKILTIYPPEKYVNYDYEYVIVKVDITGTDVVYLNSYIRMPWSEMKPMPLRDNYCCYLDVLRHRWMSQHTIPPVKTVSEKDTPLSRYHLSEDD